MLLYARLPAAYRVPPALRGHALTLALWPPLPPARCCCVGVIRWRVVRLTVAGLGTDRRRSSPASVFLTFITRACSASPVGRALLTPQQRLLLAPSLPARLLRGDRVCFQFGDSLTARTVRSQPVGRKALPTLALFSARKNKLNAGRPTYGGKRRPTARRDYALAGFCCSSLAIEIHLINLRVTQLIQSALRFAQPRAAAEMASSRAFKLCRRRSVVAAAGVRRVLSRRYRPE